MKRLLVIALSLIGCATTPLATITTTAKVTLTMRASRVMAFPGTPILLTAELAGYAEPEGLYCPTVVWAWADGTESTEAGDCPPWETRDEYPRRWTRWITLSMPGVYPIRVRLERAGSVVARQELVLTGLGGE